MSVNEFPETFRRREVLKRVAWMIGGAVSAPAALAILQGCSAEDAKPAAGAKVQYKFFKGAQGEIVTAIADAILPHTDTSGALDVGVPAFIDRMLADVYDAAAQERFNRGSAEFEIAASTGGNAFLERDAAERAEFVKESLEKALAAPRDGGKPFILMTRELTLLGFYTSQPGINENMWYQAVPTAFHGCVPVSQMEKPVYWE
jgi:gluconate 2-dehydrogenase gamma chain